MTKSCWVSLGIETLDFPGMKWQSKPRHDYILCGMVLKIRAHLSYLSLYFPSSISSQLLVLYSIMYHWSTMGSPFIFVFTFFLFIMHIKDRIFSRYLLNYTCKVIISSLNLILNSRGSFSKFSVKILGLSSINAVYCWEMITPGYLMFIPPQMTTSITWPSLHDLSEMILRYQLFVSHDSIFFIPEHLFL